MITISLSLDSNASSLVEFFDVKNDSWAYPYVKYAGNYLTGYEIGNKLYFYPNKAAVREDMAICLVLALKLGNEKYDEKILNNFSDKDQISKSAKKYVAIAYQNGLMNGNSEGTFDPQGTLTRAQAAQLISNALNKKKVVVKETLDEKYYPDFKCVMTDDGIPQIEIGDNYDKYLWQSQNSKEWRKVSSKILSFDGTYYDSIIYIKRIDDDDSNRREVKIGHIEYDNIDFEITSDGLYKIDFGSKWNEYVYMSEKGSSWRKVSSRFIILDGTYKDQKIYYKKEKDVDDNKQTLVLK